MHAWLALGAILLLAPAQGADLVRRPYGFERGPAGPPVEEVVERPPLPRFFPREGGEEAPVLEVRPRRIVQACRPRRVPIPTDAPDDPSYVGSTYGLGKPSVYGFVPALGIDDPFGRSPLPYCR